MLLNKNRLSQTQILHNVVKNQDKSALVKIVFVVEIFSYMFKIVIVFSHINDILHQILSLLLKQNNRENF